MKCYRTWFILSHKMQTEFWAVLIVATKTMSILSLSGFLFSRPHIYINFNRTIQSKLATEYEDGNFPKQYLCILIWKCVINNGLTCIKSAPSALEKMGKSNHILNELVFILLLMRKSEICVCCYSWQSEKKWNVKVGLREGKI